MVSTRGIRYKFSEGERVLCYEPDPTKAKVLYDSKVLEVIENKDKRGRRSTEYLIHFQGWNSSWDRCVGEDFVLKDTEENRLLQRDLAEKSQLQLGSYLYRRERKKAVSTSAGAGAAKRARHGFSDDGSSSSTPLDVCEPGDTDSSSGSGAHSQPRSPPPQPSRAHIALPAALRDRLTFDYHLVVKRGRLSRLPASPCAAEILESFVKWFARAGAWRPQRARHDPPQRPDLLDVSRRLNLVREVADGLRVYFDFVLRGHLLYRQEVAQYLDACGRQQQGEDSPRRTRAAPVITSPNLPEYSHLPPDPDCRPATAAAAATAATATASRANSESGNSEEAVKSEGGPKSDSGEKAKAKVDPPEEVPGAGWGAPGAPGRPREVRAAARGAGVARRLRSHKSAVSHSEDEPAPSTSTGEPRAFETLSSSVGSSASSVSECWARPAQTPAPPSNRTPLSLLLDKVSAWKIIPRVGTEHLPCRVYGAVHLTRLFVRLPNFLAASHMPDYKLKLVLKHIDMFIQYLEEHSEWFGESYYIAESSSRSN